MFQGLDQQVTQAKQQVTSISKQISAAVRSAPVTRAAGQAHHPAGRARPGDERA